jgi:hypothetical protein
VRGGNVEQREVLVREALLAARADRQDPDPVISALEPAHFDRVEAELWEQRKWARFDHRPESLCGDRLECEASGLGGAEAAGGNEVEVGVAVEQSQRCDVDREREDERVRDLLEREGESMT